MRRLKMLVVDDESNHIKLIKTYSYLMHIEVRGFTNPFEALAWAEENDFDLASIDFRMAGMNGIELTSRLRELHPNAYYVFMTAHQELTLAVDCMRAGVSDFLQKPVRLDDFRMMINRIVRLTELERENKNLHKIISVHEQILGESPEMLAVKEKIKLAGLSRSSVLITGETGVGKGLVAKTLHLAGKNRSHPFIVTNCASFAPALLESELFGHEKGSFTGADQRHIGKLEFAGGGTVFLDEISEIPSSAQVKLLHVLQEREFERIGGNKKITLNARIIAATNRDLAVNLETGAFRKDLYYRLNTIHLHIPPLRERSGDIMPLAHYFLQKFCAEYEKRDLSFTPAVEEILRSYDWPGNVRQLGNVIDYAVLSSDAATIGVENLHTELTRKTSGFPFSNSPSPQARPGGGLPAMIAKLEREKMETAIKNCGGNKSRAAFALGLTRSQFLYKLKKYGLENSGGRNSGK